MKPSPVSRFSSNHGLHFLVHDVDSRSDAILEPLFGEIRCERVPLVSFRPAAAGSRLARANSVSEENWESHRAVKASISSSGGAGFFSVGILSHQRVVDERLQRSTTDHAQIRLRYFLDVFPALIQMPSDSEVELLSGDWLLVYECATHSLVSARLARQIGPFADRSLQRPVAGPEIKKQVPDKNDVKNDAPRKPFSCLIGWVTQLGQVEACSPRFA